MAIYKTYIEYIGQQVDDTPQSAQEVAKAFLSKIEYLQ